MMRAGSSASAARLGTQARQGSSTPPARRARSRGQRTLMPAAASAALTISSPVRPRACARAAAPPGGFGPPRSARAASRACPPPPRDSWVAATRPAGPDFWLRLIAALGGALVASRPWIVLLGVGRQRPRYRPVPRSPDRGRTARGSRRSSDRASRHCAVPGPAAPRCVATADRRAPDCSARPRRFGSSRRLSRKYSIAARVSVSASWKVCMASSACWYLTTPEVVLHPAGQIRIERVERLEIMLERLVVVEPAEPGIALIERDLGRLRQDLGRRRVFAQRGLVLTGAVQRVALLDCAVGIAAGPHQGSRTSSPPASQERGARAPGHAPAPERSRNAISSPSSARAAARNHWKR